MTTQTIQQFSVIGIAIRTTNENGQSAQDIPALWHKFMTENTLEKIPNRVDRSLYCIYTDYEKDHTKPYTTILGCKVSSLTDIPAEMVGKNFETAEYVKHALKGNILEGLVFNEWTKIWNSDLPRAFTADFEVYDPAADPHNAEVDVFIAVK